MSDGHVYFVQSGPAGPVKIGWALSVRRRVEVLQCGNPEELIVRLVLPGTPDDERAFHRRFGRYRIRGEWFRPAPLLVRFLEDPAGRFTSLFRPHRGIRHPTPDITIEELPHG